MAMTTGANECDDYVLAHFHRGDTVAYFFDYAGAFVPINGRKCAAPRTFGIGDVAVTNRDCGNFYTHFAWASFC
ncbi:unannotated protein [freshwater metagenome]|uniref:Unannotated protein n=1 Tax=freshwater metagenome TaxID=449393 RepID=A0A6J6K089_9ZZZZ